MQTRQFIPILTILLLAFSTGANAAPVRASWAGIVEAADAGNAVGIEAGDYVFGFTIFDTDWLGQPFLPDLDIYGIIHNANPAFQMSLSVGNRTFTESEDNNFGVVPFFPTLGFVDISSLAAMENSFFGVSLNTCGSPFHPGCTTSDGLGFGTPEPNSWTLFDNGVEIGAGRWTLGSIKVQPIPVPAALPLLLGALGCLVALRRRATRSLN